MSYRPPQISRQRIKKEEDTLEENRKPRKMVPKGTNRMPTNSLFYDKMVPLLLFSLGAIMLLLIVVAAGILFGFFS